MNFPPNWDGPQPPMMTEEQISKILEPMEGEADSFRETLQNVVEMEKLSFEIYQISYHRICGGGAIIMAPVKGDKTNQKQYDLVCAKCGVIKTHTLPENSTIVWG